MTSHDQALVLLRRIAATLGVTVEDLAAPSARHLLADECCRLVREFCKIADPDKRARIVALAADLAR